MYRFSRKLLAGATALAAISLCATDASAGVDIGKWLVSENYNGHGATRPTAILTSADGASLIVSCTDAGLSLLVSYLSPVSTSDSLPVRWRLDQGAAQAQSWTAARGDRSTFTSGSPQAAGALLRQMAAARSLTLSAAGKRDVFDLAGARQVAALMANCPAPGSP